MTKKKDDDLTQEEWQEKFSTHLLKVVFKCIADEEKNRGEEFADNLGTAFIAGFVGSLVHHVLARRPPVGTSKQKTYEYVAAQYADIKSNIEGAVAAGFSGSLSKYSGKEVEYYCQVKIVPEPINKLAC